MSSSPTTSSHGEVNQKETSTFVDEEKAPVTSSTESPSTDINTAEEDRLVRKIDLHLLPILFVLYMFAFLDRVNIGNAKIEGLLTELNMSGTQYNVASMILFVPYIILEVPSNLLMKRIPPSAWLSGLMFGWGIITMCQGFVKSYAGLIVCRVLLGIFEAGVFPGKLIANSAMVQSKY
jgi:sugar phosphate permease